MRGGFLRWSGDDDRRGFSTAGFDPTATGLIMTEQTSDAAPTTAHDDPSASTPCSTVNGKASTCAKTAA
jgi:hypothetical protein